MSTFNIGITGLKASTTNLNAIGNNVANSSTVGFKKSRAEFADIYANSGVSSGGAKTGSGVLVSSVTQMFAQGDLDVTGNDLDLSIDGNGFFIINNNGETMYTRAGMFGLDRDGFIVNSSGARLQGYEMQNGQFAGGALTDLQIQTKSIQPKETSEIDLAVNLDSRSLPPEGYPLNPEDPDTYTRATPATIYDSLGNPHTLMQYFSKQPPYLPQLGEPSYRLTSLISLLRNESYLDTIADDDVNDGFANATGVAEIDFNKDGVFSAGDGEFALVAVPSASTGATLPQLSAGKFFLASTDVNNGFISPAGYNPDSDLMARARVENIKTLKGVLEGYLDDEGLEFKQKELYQSAIDVIEEMVPTLDVASELDDKVYASILTNIELALGDTATVYANIYQLQNSVTSAYESFLKNETSTVDPLTGVTASAASTPISQQDLASNLQDFLLSVVGALINGDTEVTYKGASTANPVNAAIQGSAADKINLAQLLGVSEDAIKEAKTNTDLKRSYQLAYDAINNAPMSEPAGSDPILDFRNVYQALTTPNSDNIWEVSLEVDGAPVYNTNSFGADGEPLLTYRIKFDEFGQLSDNSQNPIVFNNWEPFDSQTNPTGADKPVSVSINLDGSTQYGASFAVNSLTQDGYTSGRLAGLQVDLDGNVQARYTNGQVADVAKVAVATFDNPQGLDPVGGTNWRQTLDSGQPTVNEARTGTAGAIKGGTLESSNVDLSEELVKMILAQRDFQANSKTIQTADTLSQTIINLR